MVGVNPNTVYWWNISKAKAIMFNNIKPNCTSKYLILDLKKIWLKRKFTQIEKPCELFFDWCVSRWNVFVFLSSFLMFHLKNKTSRNNHQLFLFTSNNIIWLWPYTLNMFSEWSISIWLENYLTENVYFVEDYLSGLT